MPGRNENELQLWFTKEVERLQNHLGCGGAEDYAQYRYLCGQIHGLRLAWAEWAAGLNHEEEG